MKYRKKPVVIEAFKWTGGPDQTEDPAWMVDAIKSDTARLMGANTSEVYMLIDTLEGVMRANQGDYIIRGVKGEIYPCKPDIFEVTYGAVLTAPQTAIDEVVERIETDIEALNFVTHSVTFCGKDKDDLASDLRTVLDALGNTRRDQSLYYDLLFSVGHVWEGEGRHETAKRYILEAEMRDPNPAQERPRPFTDAAVSQPPAPSQ